MKIENKDLLKNLALILKKRRRQLGLTQLKLGQHAGCGVAFIYLLESGKHTIRLDKLMDVLAVLGLQLHVEAGTAGLVMDEKIKCPPG